MTAIKATQRWGRNGNTPTEAFATSGRMPSVRELAREFDKALVQLRALTGAEACELFLRDPGNGDLLLATHCGPNRRAFREITRFRIGQGFPGLAAERGEPVFSSNLTEDSRFIRSKVKQEGFCFYFSAPIRTNDGVGGIIGLASRTALDIGSLCSHLAFAAERLAVLIELHRMRCCLAMDGVACNPHQVDGQSYLESTISAVLRDLIGLSDADGGVILLHDPATGTMRQAETCGAFQQVCRIVSNGKCLNACMVGGGEQCMAFLRREDSPSSMCRSMLREFAGIVCLPLRDEDHLYGISILGYRSHKPEAVGSMTFLPSVASRAAHLVRNAYAVLEMERRAAARENERVRAELGSFVLQNLEQIATRAEAATVLASLTSSPIHPEMVALNAMLRESRTAIENRVAGRGGGESAAPEKVRALPLVIKRQEATDGDHNCEKRRDFASGEEAAGFLDLRCLGRLSILRDGQAIPLNHFNRRRALTMLKILLTNYGRAVSKDTLIDILWPEAEAARGASLLKVAAHYLRRGLEPDAPNGRASRFIKTVGDGYMFNTEAPHRYDVKEFLDKYHLGERLIELGDFKAGLALWQAAADLYAGDYLEEEIYSDWSMQQREHIREKFISLAQRIADLMLQEGNGEDAVAYYRRALEVDAAQEAIHRGLMRALWQLGRRDEALRQYRLCQEVLGKELGTRPLPETEALYDQIAGNTLCLSRR